MKHLDWFTVLGWAAAIAFCVLCWGIMILAATRFFSGVAH